MPASINGRATSSEDRRSRMRQPSWTVALGLITILLAACGSSATPTTSAADVPTAIPSPTTDPALSPSPVAPPTATPGPGETPSTSPSSTPSAAPIAAGWTGPIVVDRAANCQAVVAGIDASSRYHVAAECDQKIRYASRSASGVWTSTVFAPPAHRFELGPEIAFQGDTVYLAYTRVAPVDGGCGESGLTDVGVYYRTRTSPSGSWSAPIRIGAVNDGLDAFRVDGATIHATVLNATDNGYYYETVTGGAVQRYPIKDAIGPIALRIGSDRRARIAYEGTKTLRFGVFNGSTFATSSIPRTTPDDWAPVLALDAADHAHLVWTHSYHGFGCAGPGPGPQDGTYYATNASGSWVTSRLTRATGMASFQVDDTTGRVDVVVAGDAGLAYYTRTPGGSWAGTILLSRVFVWSPVIRRDPATGSLFVVYSADPVIEALTLP